MDNLDCPENHQCDHTSGHTPSQCVRVDGACSCSDAAVETGAVTSCLVSNQFGQCEGVAQCQDNGVPVCTGTSPKAEVCNLVDDDCDGEIDEGLGGEPCGASGPGEECPGLTACLAGVMACEPVLNKGELCDGQDNNCDGQIDEGFSDVDVDGIADCVDGDMDGDGTLNEDDCAHDNSLVFPGATEICNGLDDDCDGVIDPVGSTGCVMAYPDEDLDGFGSGAGGACFCEPPPGDYVSKGDDCDDLQEDIHPEGVEVCDGKDND